MTKTEVSNSYFMYLNFKFHKIVVFDGVKNPPKNEALLRFKDILSGFMETYVRFGTAVV